MMTDYTYIQRSGKLLGKDGVVFAVGYSGRNQGKNNPAMQDVQNMGPIPVGLYRIGDAYTHEHLGPLTMNLTPDAANEMFGRGEFRIHGDSKAEPGMASHGCIIMPHEVRDFIASHLAEGQRSLEVIAEESEAA